MKFQSRYNRHRVVVRPTYKTIIAPGQEKLHTGLHAEFIGPQRLFDSELQAARLGWSDEQRLEVERHLLESVDFGVRYYLALGQSVPAEHKDAAIRIPEHAQVPPENQEPPEDERVCAMVWVTEDGTTQCERKPRKGSDFCPKHAKETAETAA